MVWLSYKLLMFRAEGPAFEWCLLPFLFCLLNIILAFKENEGQSGNVHFTLGTFGDFYNPPSPLSVRLRNTMGLLISYSCVSIS